MASGFVFAYLVIAALVAPLLWLLWWGVDSLGGAGRLHATAAPIHGSETRHPGARRWIFEQPQPVDITLARSSSAVTVHRLDGTQVDVCPGPDRAGRCPRALADGTVPCAGSVLSLRRPVRGSTEWHIPPGYQTCLVGSYDVFRQAGTATR